MSLKGLNENGFSGLCDLAIQCNNSVLLKECHDRVKEIPKHEGIQIFIKLV